MLGLAAARSIAPSPLKSAGIRRLEAPPDGYVAAGRNDPIQVQLVEVAEPGGSYVDFLIPGLLGMNMMNGGLWGLGFVLVDMRIRKLLKRMAATPMRRPDFLLAILTGRLLLVLLELIVLLSLVLHKWADLWIALALLVVNTLLGFLQESRASSAVSAASDGARPAQRGLAGATGAEPGLRRCRPAPGLFSIVHGARVSERDPEHRAAGFASIDADVTTASVRFFTIARPSPVPPT